MLIGAAPEALPMLMAEALPLSMAKVPLVGPVTVATRIESGPPMVVVVAERPMLTARAFAVPMLIGERGEALPMLMAEALPLSIAKVPLVGPVTVAPRIESGPPIVVVVAERPMLTVLAFAVPMLIGARPEALPMLMAEALPLSIENVPDVGPVTVAPRIESGPPIVVVVAARPMVTVLALAVPMLIGARPEALPMLMAEALPLSIENVPDVGPVTVAPRIESGPPIVVVVAARPMVTVLALAVPMLICAAPDALPM